MDSSHSLLGSGAMKIEDAEGSKRLAIASPSYHRLLNVNPSIPLLPTNITVKTPQFTEIGCTNFLSLFERVKHPIGHAAYESHHLKTITTCTVIMFSLLLGIESLYIVTG